MHVGTESKKRKTSGAKFPEMENLVLSKLDRQFRCVRLTVNQKIPRDTPTNIGLRTILMGKKIIFQKIYEILSRAPPQGRSRSNCPVSSQLCSSTISGYLYRLVAAGVKYTYWILNLARVLSRSSNIHKYKKTFYNLKIVM